VLVALRRALLECISVLVRGRSILAVLFILSHFEQNISTQNNTDKQQPVICLRRKMGDPALYDTVRAELQYTVPAYTD